MKIISGSTSWPRVDEEDFWSKLDLNDELDQPHQVQYWSLIGQHNNDLWLVNTILNWLVNIIMISDWSIILGNTRMTQQNWLTSYQIVFIQD